MKNDKQKRKNTVKSKKQNKYRALSLMLTSSLVIAPLTVPLSFYLPGGITASAAILDAEILSNITSSNNSGTTAANRWAADGTSQNVDFTISGDALVGGSIATTGMKQAVLTIPTELNGRVSPNGTALIDTNVTVTVGSVAFLSATLTAANQLSTLITDIAGGSLGLLTGVTFDLTTVNQKIAALNNIQNFGSAQFSSTATLAADGTYISAGIDDGLGLVLAQNISSLLLDLKAATDALTASGSNFVLIGAINTALTPVKLAVDTAIDTALPFIQVGGTGFNQLADASVLGATTITIPTTVVSPTSLAQNLDAKFVGTVVKTDIIDVPLFDTANGVSTIYYAGTAVVVAPPVVTTTTGTSATGYTVTGTATAGDTVEIRTTGGTVIGTGVADGSGNFTISIPQGQATASESLNAVAKNGTNESTPTPFMTPADPAPTVAPPVVTNTIGTSATGYTVTGTATAGDTVEIRTTGGTVIGTGVADLSGNFIITIPIGSATASESLNAVAKNGLNESTPTPFTTPADPIAVAAPTVNTVTGTSATGYTVMGTATIGDTVEIKNLGGTVIGSAPVDLSGNYTITIPVGAATPSEQLTAVAKDLIGTTSPATPFTTPADPVVVPAPTVDTVTGTSGTGYTVTGTAPAGDTVEVRNTGGTVIGTAVADPSGNYTLTIPVGSATPSEQLSAVAKDGAGNTSPATPFTTPADPVVVPAPTVDSVIGTSATGYTVMGTATAGDTVEVRNTGGTVIGTAIADLIGNYTLTIPVGAATPSEQLSAVAKDPAGNTSPATPFTTPADPIAVAAPTVDTVTGTSATGYTVMGTATIGDTVEIKNLGGTVIGSALVDLSGNYTITIPIGSATPSEQLTAVAKDLIGTTSPATLFTTPADPVVVPAPTVDTVTGTSGTGYTVTGTAPAGDTVEVRNTGGTVIGTAVADPSGNYTLTIPVGAATPSEQLSAVAKDGAGNTSPATPFTTPADPVVVPAPTVDSVIGTSATGYTVMGTAPAGDTVEVRNTGGTVLGTAVADPSGNYTLTIPVGAATSSEQLSAVAKDPAGNTSPATPFTTPADPIAVAAPTVDTVTGTSATGYTVMGTATIGDTVEIKNLGGTVIGSAPVDLSGNYTITIPVGAATPSEQLTAVAKDLIGSTSPATPFTTPADPVVVPAPTVDTVTGTSGTGYTVTGTAPAGDTVEVRNTGGTVLGTAVADPSGNYTLTIPVGAATPSEQLSAVAKDGAGNTSPATPFTTPADPVVVPAPTVDSVIGTSGTGYTVMGTAPAGDTVEVRNTGGTVLGTAVADPSGNYTLTIPVGAATPSEQLSAVAKDPAGNTSPATSFTTPADPIAVAAPTVDTVTGTSGTGYTVMGTATIGDTVEIKNLGGTVIGSALVDLSGNYTITIPVGAATPSEQLTAVAKDLIGNTSPATPFTTPADPVVVPAPTVDTVTGTSATGYTVMGTATAGDTVEVRNTGGTVLGTAVADPSGNYTLTIPVGAATPSEQLSAVAKDGAGNTSSATPFTTPADPIAVPAPTVDTVTGTSGTGYTVMGTAPAGDTVEVRNTGGTVLGTAVADPSGNYTLTIPVGAATPSEQLTAVAKDPAGNTSPATSFTTPADPITVAAPTVDTVTGNSASGYTVNGTATAGDTVEVRNTGGTVLGTATVDSSGNYTITLPVGAATPSEQLTAVAKDVAGNTSPATPFTTPADPAVIVATPRIISVTGNSLTGYEILGTATPGDQVEIFNAADNLLTQGTVGADGGFTVILLAGLAQPSEQLTAITKDSDNNQSAPVTFTLPADPAAVAVSSPIVDNVTGSSTTGYTVNGTADPGNTINLYSSGGALVGMGTVDAGGNYDVQILVGLVMPNETASAVAIDSNGNQSNPTTFMIPADPGMGTGTGTNNGNGSNGGLNNNGKSGLQNLSRSKKNLPNNGEIVSNWGLLGALLLGSLGIFSFKRRNKKEEE